MLENGVVHACRLETRPGSLETLSEHLCTEHRGRRTPRCRSYQHLALHFAICGHTHVPGSGLQRLPEGKRAPPSHRGTRATRVSRLCAPEDQKQALSLGRRQPLSHSQPNGKRTTGGVRGLSTTWPYHGL